MKGFDVSLHFTFEKNSLLFFFLQDSNPLLKESLQRGEDAAFWMSQKTREMIDVANLEQPLKQMDFIAAKTIEDMENRTKMVILVQR